MKELLAMKMRPQKLSEVIGQKHLIGQGQVISNLVKNKQIFSMILYGKPGIGKTSLAMAIVSELKMRYRILNAVINNKKDFDTVVEEAKMYQGIILIIDEIHRLNKDKQDLLLPVIESGLITLIGLTSTNPFHSINPTIRSRCLLFELHDLTYDDILLAIDRVISSSYLEGLQIDNDAKEYLANISKNDLRYVYNLLEVAYYAIDDHHLTTDNLINITNKPNIFIDKNEDGYYDLLSALQKSIRGSDVNASLYYLGLLITGGELEAICRRLSVIVYEDIGLANPSLGPIVSSAISSALLLGLPEARIPLSVIVIELSLSPKSNSALLSIDKAIDINKQLNPGNIPRHLKNPSKEYKYPHNYKNSYVYQQYLPDNIKNVKFYQPKDNKNEKMKKEIIDKLEKLSQ